MSQRRKRSDSLVDVQLGDYRLIERLATGGMAKIYIGEDVKLGRRVAVKVLTEEMLEHDSSLTERFQREAKAVAALDHPNIVPIYQYGEEVDLYFLAMKLIEGEDLADELNRLNREKLLISPRRMIDIMKQVASALDYAHSKGIIHRDVKPSNILLDKEGRAFLTDFGLVLRQEIDQTHGTAFGTPRYISPEQALASEDAIAQSDVYSLAVIVYEALTGSMVFKADTAMQIALSHISENPPPPRVINPSIPRAVEIEVLKALRKRPEERHPSAGKFIAAIEAAYGSALTDEMGISPELLDSRTPPMRPAEMDKVIEKHISSANKYRPETLPEGDDDHDTEMSSESRRPASRRQKRANPLGIMTLSAIALTAIVIAAFLTFASGEEPTANNQGSSPTVSSESTEDSAQIAGTLARTTLHYNSMALALRNDSKDPIDLGRISLQRDDGSDAFTPADMSRSQIDQSECLLVSSNSGSGVIIDSNWKCAETSPSPHQRPTAALFWRVNESSSAFVVLVDGEVVATCTAIEAGRESTCTVQLPIIASS